MDINYLLHRHQTSLMRADAATCAPSRHAHQKLAAGYAAEVTRAQEARGGTGRLMPATTGNVPA